jgi:hypothetical protein
MNPASNHAPIVLRVAFNCIVTAERAAEKRAAKSIRLPGSFLANAIRMTLACALKVVVAVGMNCGLIRDSSFAGSGGRRGAFENCR